MTAWDVATPTSLGTGVAKTQINGGVNLTKPTQAKTLLEVVPYLAPSAALTAEQSMLVEAAIESDSINLLPKRLVVSPILGGLGAFTAALSPVLLSYKFNTPLGAGSTQQFSVYGQAQVANTAAPTLGCAFHYSESETNEKEMFYTKPDNETSTGTAATTVTGSSVTINGGRFLESIYPVVTPVTPTASESLIGDIQISSDDFDNSMPLRVPIQPVATALGATVTMMLSKMAVYKNIHRGMKSSAVINTSYRQSEALTVAGNFIAGFGYTKS